MPAYVDVNPAMLAWARTRAGYTTGLAAKRLGVVEEKLLAWEAGTAPLPEGRFERLADMYKRSYLTFFLPEPPVEETLDATDFRDGPHEQAPRLRYQIRRASERRDTALSLLTEAGEEVPIFDFKTRLGEDPELAGARLRQVLGVSEDAQRSWAVDGVGYAAASGWREAAERAGVLVLQAPKGDLDASGVSLHADQLPVVIQASEWPRRRCFTLLHELAHLGLREGGICDLADVGVERFCNRVAAAALMPSDAVEREFGRAGPPSTERLGKLARAFSVSEEAFAVRLVELRHVDRTYYEGLREYFAEKARRAESKPEKGKGGGPSQPVLALAYNGRTFTRVVLQALQRGSLTEHRAAVCLGTSAKWMPEIERNLLRALFGKGVQEA